MEKKYSVKLIDVLYYDNKVLPVTYVRDRKGNKSLLFLLNNATLAIEDEISGVATYNKGAYNVMTLCTANATKRYAEIGTLTSAIINYGKDDKTNFPNLFNIKKLVSDKNTIDDEKYTNIAKEYFNTNLTVSEIKLLFAELQKGYDIKKYNCPSTCKE